MSKGSSDTNQKTVSISEPSSVVKPYLADAYKKAQAQYNQGAPGYYPGQLVAPMSNYTNAGWTSLAQRGAQGSPVTDSAKQQLMSTLNGSYLNSGNPYLQNAIQGAIRPMVNSFNDQVMPGLDSNFSEAGRYGSGAHALASSDAASQLENQIGDVSSQMAYQNYGDERQRQMQGMLFAPQMAAQDYIDINALQQAGQGYDQYNQQQIDANKAKYDYNATAQHQWLSDYIGMLNGYPGSSTTTKGPASGSSGGGGLGGAATGALGGALTGAKLGSIIPGLGTGIGAIGGGLLGALGGALAGAKIGAMLPTPIPGLGALGGGLLGGLGGLFS